MKFGARNQLAGVVKGVKRGSVMGQVDIEIPAAFRMGSVMTVDSLDDLNLRVEDKVMVSSRQSVS